jgi:hypothetical protein
MVTDGGSGGAGHGDSAGELAAQVPGCAAHEVDLQSRATSLGLPQVRRLLADAGSAATCTLQGRTALLVTYANRQQESTAATVADRMTAYFASGPGWLALPVDLSEPVGQQSVVQDVALALHGMIQVGAKAPRVSKTGG